MGQPCLVEMQVFNIAVQQPLDGFGVIQHPVIGGLRQRHDARFHRIRINMLQQRVGADFRADRLDFEL